MKLFLVHCGFYDSQMQEGMYEHHANLFVVAQSFQEAREKAKQDTQFRKRKMHIDGIQMLEAIDGYRVALEEDASLEGKSDVQTDRYRGLAPRNSDTKTLH